MEDFDAFEELFAAVERHVQQHGQKPREVVVSPSLYLWLSELQREAVMMRGEAVADVVHLETPYGAVSVTIDEMMSAFDVATL